MQTITIDFDLLSRELAGQYANGYLSSDEYLTLWEQIVLEQVSGNTNNTVAV